MDLDTNLEVTVVSAGPVYFNFETHEAMADAAGHPYLVSGPTNFCTVFDLGVKARPVDDDSSWETTNKK